VIGLVTATASGRAMARRLADAWPGECTVHSGPVAEQIRVAWSGSDTLVCFLATGATVRLVAPLLADKHSDPGVVCVDEAGTHAVALLGGHAGGANTLAVRVSEVLGTRAVVSTATDVTGGTPLDSFGADLGFRLAGTGGLARVTRAVLDGAPVRLVADATWPVPALPTVDGPGLTIAVSDRRDAQADLVYRPPSLVVGVGASRGAPDRELETLVRNGLAEAGLASSEQGETTCCYAAQDKFWVAGAPDGEAWEIYTVLADSPTFYAEGHGEACCGGTGTCQAGEPATTAAQCC